MMNRPLILSVATLVAASASARIVHTPAAAIASLENPKVVDGAAWSVHRRVWWNDPQSAANVLPACSDWATGLPGFAPKAGGVPCVVVNVTASPQAPTDVYGAPGMNGDADFVVTDPVAPGELIMHPEVVSSTSANRVVLRFTVPRDGRYSLDALFRPVNGVHWNSKQLDVSVLLDNVLLDQFELAHPSATERHAFAFADKYLLKDQVLDIVVGAGFSETAMSTPTHQGDAVAVKLQIVEEDETEAPVEKSWDLATALHAEGQKSEPTCPFPADDESGSLATWAFYRTEQGPFFFEYTSPRMFNTWARDAALDGPRVSFNGDANEHVSAQNPAAQSSVLAQMGTDGDSTPDRVGPGEVVFHPNNFQASPWVDDHLTMRFVVPADGRYVASYALRDISLANAGNRADSRNGVAVRTMAGSVFMEETDKISRELGPSHAFSQVTTPSLKAGTAIDFMVYNRGSYVYDGTAGRIQVFKLKDSALVADFCAATALRANALGAKTNPFTDAQGATWTLGKSRGVDGTGFVPLAARETTAKFEGWANDSTDTNESLYKGLPWMRVNTTLDRVDNATDGTVISGQVLFPNELFIHPSSVRNTHEPIYAVLRFAAPRDGVYSLDMMMRDLHPATTLAAGAGGVMAYVMGPDFHAAAGLACVDANNSACWTHLHPDRLYLRKDEHVDICVAPKPTRQTNCDATALYENIHFAEADTEPILGIDITTAGTGGRYIARGRVGWSDQAWRRTVTAEAGLQARNMKAGDKVAKTVFTATRAAGEIATTLDEAQAKNLLKGGVVSTGEADTYTFTLTELAPETSYRLYCYGRSLSDGVQPVFTVADQSVSPSLSWSRPFVNDVAVLTGRTDSTGRLTGTFRSSADGQTTFCGLQVAEGDVPLRRGLLFLVK